MTHKRILVRQVKEWGEILSGLETRNRYDLFDEAGGAIGQAAELGGGLARLFTRSVLGRCRRATLVILDPSGEESGRGEKPFRFYFHRMEVFEGERKVGAIQRRFSLLHRKFEVENADGEVVLEIFSPLFRIWTFKILFHGQEVGVIKKEWGGALREVFTDADSFGVEYLDSPDMERLRTLLLCATFLIDFTCFENNQKN